MASYPQCNPSSTQPPSNPPSQPESPDAAGSAPPSDGGLHPAFARPDDWEENPVLRATFLRLLPPEAAAHAVALGRSAYAAVVADPHLHAEPWIACELRAAAADLRSLARFLAEVGRERFDSDLPEYEARLSEQAEGLTIEVDELADLVERLIADP